MSFKEEIKVQDIQLHFPSKDTMYEYTFHISVKSSAYAIFGYVKKWNPHKPRSGCI